MINKVILLGNLGKDPEVRTLESGVKVARVSIATNENFRDKNTNEWKSVTEWHDLVLWRYNAEKVESYTKGTMVYVEGKLTHRKWTDKDGGDRYTTEIVVNLIRRIPTRDQRQDNPMNTPGTFSADSSSESTNKSETSSADHPTMDVEDDLPF